jgi:parallel beta-helix repeat protein
MTDYYCDPTDSGSNLGTQANPWQSWTDVQAGTNGSPPGAGDTVYFAGGGGSYDEQPSVAQTQSLSGTAGNPITFVGCNSSWVVDGTKYVFDFTTPTNTDGLDFDDTDYIVMRHFEVKNADYNGFDFALQSATSYMLIDCVAHTNGDSGFYLYRMTNSHLIRCVAHNNGGDGFEYAYSNAHLLFCCARDNAGDGFQQLGDGMLWAVLP